MATTELASGSEPQRASRWLPRGLTHAWFGAYVAFWLATLAPAAVVAMAGHPLVLTVRRWLGLALSARGTAPPTVGNVVVLAAHNIPIASWPLLLGVLGAHRSRPGRWFADGVVVMSMIANTLPVGAAFGAYGTALVAYVPQLPLEWGALALGASGWLIARRRPLTVSTGLGVFALVAVALVSAAVLETFAVPHQ